MLQRWPAYRSFQGEYVFTLNECYSSSTTHYTCFVVDGDGDVTLCATLGPILQKMVENDVHALPVVQGGSASMDYYGFVSMLDIVTWLVDRMGELYFTTVC